MKILISGSSGFVGSRVLHQWQGRAELFTFPRGSLAAADESAIRRFAETVQPDVILHLAALSDTGYCQQHPEESQRANVELPIWMAKAAQDTGAKLISFSSDQVYAGVTQPGPLPETLPLSPANTYGRHKLEAEERILALCPEAVLLRAPWMYDLPGDGLPLRGNLPLNLLQAAQNGTPVRFSPHDHRGVSWVREVVEQLFPALQLPGGVYNFGSGNDADMVTTARQFAEALGVQVQIEPADFSRNLVMDSSKLAAQGIRFHDTLSSFEGCLGRIKPLSHADACQLP